MGWSPIPAEPFSVRFDGVELAGVLTRAVSGRYDAVALLLHGGPDGSKDGPSGLFVRLAEALAEAGIASARVDFRGEGDSGGNYADTTPSDQVHQYSAVVAALRQRGYDRFAVVGESFGATCALRAYDPVDVAALVLLWPAIWLLDGTFAPFVTDAQLEQADRRGFIEMEGRPIGRAFLAELLADSDREGDLRRVQAPTLLIHGDADTEVPWTQSVRAHDLLPEPKRLVVVPGADHCLRRPPEQQLVVAETVEWLTRHLP